MVQATGNAAAPTPNPWLSSARPHRPAGATVEGGAPSKTVTLAPGSTIDIGTNAGVYVDGGSITITGAGPTS